jgi:hypothetical protein
MISISVGRLNWLVTGDSARCTVRFCTLELWQTVDSQVITDADCLRLTAESPVPLCRLEPVPVVSTP